MDLWHKGQTSYANVLRRLINDSMWNKNMPSLAQMKKVISLRPGAKVLVYREGKGWKLYTFVWMVGNTVDVILPSNHISNFALSVVRPFLEEDKIPDPDSKKPKIVHDAVMTRSRTKNRASISMLGQEADEECYISLAGLNEKEFFHDSRKEEWKGCKS